jgi:hypothetical protein
MDRTPIPKPHGCRILLHAVGEAWSWRLTTADGKCARGLAPDLPAARRSAAFAAFAVTAFARLGQRRF